MNIFIKYNLVMAKVLKFSCKNFPLENVDESKMTDLLSKKNCERLMSDHDIFGSREPNVSYQCPCAFGTSTNSLK